MKTYIRWAFVYDENSVVEIWAEINEDAKIIFMELTRRSSLDIIGFVKKEQRQNDYSARYEYWSSIKDGAKVEILMNEKYGKRWLKEDFCGI